MGLGIYFSPISRFALAVSVGCYMLDVEVRTHSLGLVYRIESVISLLSSFPIALVKPAFPTIPASLFHVLSSPFLLKIRCRVKTETNLLIPNFLAG
jgi:hypothetical protein